MKKIVLLQHFYNEIGGIETFLYNFCKQFGDKYDITLVCRSISPENALKLAQYVNVVCEVEREIECDTCIITSVLVDLPVFKNIKYKEIYQMIHSDWTKMRKFWDWKFIEYDENTKYIAVSECARQSFIREYGRDSVVIPNLVMVEEPPMLKLLSCTRLTEEKGYLRMCKLCDLLEENGITYIWDVYGTNPLNYPLYKNMVLHSPIQQANKLMPDYDYVVQLSDTESMCLTMYESLMQHTPVLVTPFPNAEKDIKNGVNGYILPFDMKLTKDDIMNIVNKKPTKVDYKQKGVIEEWEKILK